MKRSRMMAVLDPIKLVIDNYPEGEVEYLDAAGPEKEAQAIAELGTPEEVAHKILEEQAPADSSAAPASVSYTHLDVYKRQALDRAGGL